MPWARESVMRRLFGRALVLVSVLALIGVLLKIWAVHRAGSEIEKLANACGAEWAERDRARIEVDLLAGDVNATTIIWHPRPLASGASFSAVWDTISIEGLSYWALITDGTIMIDRVQVKLAHGDRHPGTDSLPPHRSPSQLRMHIGGLRTDVSDLNLWLNDSTLAYIGNAKVRMDRLATLPGRSAPIVLPVGVEAEVEGLMMQPFADSLLVVDHVTIDGDVTRILGIHFGVSDVKHASSKLELERDVVSCSIDSLEVIGLSPVALFSERWHARSLSIANASLSVARDKLLPDPPFKEKPLPAELLRSLPPGCGADTIRVERMQVDYYERSDPSRGFAHVPFTRINGILRNAFHSTSTDSAFVVDATALVLEGTPIALHLEASVADSARPMMVRSSVGAIPFRQLDVALVPLMGITAPEGRLDTVIVHMTAGRRSAQARCLMRYTNLKVERRSAHNSPLDPLATAVLNVLIKGRRTGERRGDGWVDYTVDRRRDRGIFNYLWRGVRDGAKASMLPIAPNK